MSTLGGIRSQALKFISILNIVHYIIGLYIYIEYKVFRLLKLVMIKYILK